MATRLTLNCQTPNWESDLFSFLNSRIEVDLVGFDYAKHGKYCESLAQRFSMEVRMDRDLKSQAVSFRLIPN